MPACSFAPVARRSRHARRARRAAALVLLAAPAWSPLRAQDVVPQTNPTVLSAALGMHYQGYSFASGSDVEKSSLFLVPLSFQMVVAPGMVLDAYSVHVRARATSGTTVLKFDGQLDSWARLRWQYNPSTVVAIGISVPTGEEKQTAEQAAVASVISNDLLGYREGNWGAGWSTTAGISTFWRPGTWRLSAGASYRLAAGFEPQVDTTLRYNPGSELRGRIGAVRTFSTGTFETGLTVQTFTIDKLDKKNLFQAGPRVRFDLSYDWPTTRLSFTNLWRSKGDLSAPIINALDGTYLRDTLITIGWQNLMIVGASGTLRVADKFNLVPEASYKIRTASDRAGRGSLALVGFMVPFQYADLEIFPGVKYGVGRLIPSLAGASYKSLSGGELSLIIRHATRRH